MRAQTWAHGVLTYALSPGQTLGSAASSCMDAGWGPLVTQGGIVLVSLLGIRCASTKSRIRLVND